MELIKKLQFIIGLITLVSMAVCVVSIIFAIITESDLWAGIMYTSFTMLICGFAIYKIWEWQLNK